MSLDGDGDGSGSDTDCYRVPLEFGTPMLLLLLSLLVYTLSEYRIPSQPLADGPRAVDNKTTTRRQKTNSNKMHKIP